MRISEHYRFLGPFVQFHRTYSSQALKKIGKMTNPYRPSLTLFHSIPHLSHRCHLCEFPLYATRTRNSQEHCLEIFTINSFILSIYLSPSSFRASNEQSKSSGYPKKERRKEKSERKRNIATSTFARRTKRHYSPQTPLNKRNLVKPISRTYLV